MKRRKDQTPCVGYLSCADLPRVWASRSTGGFSVLELLVTVVIVLILMGLFWSPNSESRQRALRKSCQKNLQKLYVSMEIYANDNGGKFPEVQGARTSAEVLDVLVPRYTSDTSLFACPGSKVSTPPPGESIRKRKISYAYYMGRYLTNAPEALLSDKQVDTSPKVVGQLLFSTSGKPPGNNHRKFGGNVLFSDGHVETSSCGARFPLPLKQGEVLLNP
ncbi:MAG TPA: type II secretion system protein [Clostridia bacterium]|nr:type II secretion system protein [Clostridia bacterium]